MKNPGTFFERSLSLLIVLDRTRRNHGDYRRRTFDEISRALQEFAQSDDLLPSPDRMREFSDSWVAVCKGNVLAVAKDLNVVRDQLHREGLPLGTVAIRFIEKDGIAAV
jgi:hypothetical protein